MLALRGVELVDAVRLEEIGELNEIGPIGEAGVGSQATFDSQMIEKGVDQLLHCTTSLVAGHYRRAFDVGEVCYLKRTKKLFFVFDIANRWLISVSQMETWKEFEANELTHSAAHHLLAIYEVGLKYGGWARVS